MANPFYQSMMNNMMMPPARPNNPVQALLQQAADIYQSMQNPQAFMQQYFPNVPANYRNTPDQLLQYLQHTGSVTPQQLAFLNQFSCPVR